MPVRDDPEDINRMMREGERLIAREFAYDVRQTRQEMTDDELDEAVLPATPPRDHSDKLAVAVLALLLLVGRSTTATIEAQVPERLSFDPSGPAVARLLRENRARITQALAESQAAANRRAVLDALIRGATQEEMRTAIRQAQGLTERQVSHLTRLRRALSSASDTAQRGMSPAEIRAVTQPGMQDALGRALSGARPLTRIQIDAIIERRSVDLMVRRAQTIAQSEATRVTNQAAQEAWNQAAAAGAVPPSGAPPEGTPRPTGPTTPPAGGGRRRGRTRGNAGQLDERWWTQEDERVRASHENLHNEPRNPDGYWHGTAGRLLYPGDPEAPIEEWINCRCFIVREAE